VNFSYAHKPSFTCPHLTSSLKASPLVATAFTPVFVPISTSAAAVISSEVAAIV
jgi:hypothetical protein